MKGYGSQAPATHTTFSLPILLSGVVLGVSFPPNGYPVLAWVAFVPLLRRWDELRDPHDMLTEAYTAFLLAYALAFFWPLLTTFPQTLALSMGGLLLIPLVLAMPFAVSLPVRQHFGRAAGLGALLAVYLSVELILQHGPLPFPWAVLGNTQASLLPVAQIAEWTGVPGLTLWVLVINALLFLAVSASGRREQVGAVLLAAILLGAGWVGGRWLQERHLEPEGYITVGLVQPGLTSRMGEDDEEERLTRLVQLSDSLMRAMGVPPTLLIWPGPSTDVRHPDTRRERYLGTMQRWTDQMQAALLLGAQLQSDATGQRRTEGRYSSAVLLRPENSRLRYDQVDLVPFAEHVPLSQHFPWLRPLFQPSHETQARIPGHRRSAMTYESIHIGVLIGFEAILSGPGRTLAQQQADFFVAMTHDAWWGRTPGYRQHLAYVRLRAIAARKAVVQVTRSGSTAVIAPDGSTIHAVDPQAALSRLVAVPLYRRSTLFSVAGDWISLLALSVTGLLGAWYVLGQRPVASHRSKPQLTSSWSA